MKIGIIGVGHIGKSLAQQLSAAGHDVKVSNSRGPETIEADVLTSGARAVSVSEAVEDVEVVILSVPLGRIPQLVPIIAGLPAETVVIDTSNYYPARDGEIAAIEGGQVESVWVSEQLNRPVVKAWNAIGSGSLASKGRSAGSPDRIAIPVAADSQSERRLVMDLVNDTGLDAFDAGTLAESWRQQPGNPVYCTDLSMSQIPDALARADATSAPARRDLVVAAIVAKFGDDGANPDAEFGVRVARDLFN